MIRAHPRALLLGLLLTIALAVVALAFPAHGTTALDVYFLTLGALAAGAVATRTRDIQRRAPSPIDRPLRPLDRGTGRVAERERIERLVVLGAGSSFDLHYRLRPLLRELAGSRLGAHGIELDSSPEAPTVLGPDLWRVVRPDVVLGNRAAPGLSVAELERLVTALEAV